MWRTGVTKRRIVPTVVTNPADIAVARMSPKTADVFIRKIADLERSAGQNSRFRPLTAAQKAAADAVLERREPIIRVRTPTKEELQREALEKKHAREQDELIQRLTKVARYEQQLLADKPARKRRSRKVPRKRVKAATLHERCIARGFYFGQCQAKLNKTHKRCQACARHSRGAYRVCGRHVSSRSFVPFK